MASATADGPFEYARQRPVQLVAGLFTGIMSTLLTFGYLWFFAPISPLMLCGATMAFRRTTAFSVGRLHGFFGVFTFDALFTILYWL
ncbi:hypothetical protein OK015_17150 [Mycobacterium sp. Aquia_216]|uniref:hypothetical protein n=1 Tax=Mycobacterium sp. Aquia_216 TaxID=2991729 RepID=UPI00227A861C|nr:hypothetical protein [Mycobacterium sp. Aquia_216]WAJ42974.1 hypothetical protein OK015_17150 [Mycobacterium sp. Aquia_216]